MKLSIFPVLLLLSFTGYAQAPSFRPASRDIPGFHEHDGFYLSLSPGLIFGPINDHLPGGDIVFKGTGSEFDLKVGGAIRQNLILHATLLSKALSSPEVVINGQPATTALVTLGETMIGAGMTYYFMPQNLFVSASLGTGNFTLVTNNGAIKSEQGFSVQLKGGKEWWVSRNWGLGLGITFGKTSAINHFPGGIENLDSNRIGVLFNATFN